MAEITLELRTASSNRNAIEEADLLWSVSGAWSGTARLADPDQPDWSGAKVRIMWMGQQLLGTVDAQSIAEGKTTVFVVAGDGKLLAEVPAKHYQNASGTLLLQEACQAAGERFTAARLPSPAQFSQFPRERKPLCAVLDDLARILGCIWGALADGTVWLGEPTWDDAGDFDADHLDEDAIYQTAEFSPRVFGPLPGQTYQGRRIGCARYTTHPEHGPRLRLWFTQDGTQLDDDPLRSGLQRLIRETLPLTWLGKYPGTVRAVRSYKAWDVTLDEKRLPPLVGVRPRVFCPGAKIVPRIGDRVEVSFEHADPRLPVAELAEPGDGQHALVQDGDHVDCGTLTLSVTGGGGSPAVLGGTYHDPFGNTTAVSSGTAIPLKGKALASQTKVYLP